MKLLFIVFFIFSCSKKEDIKPSLDVGKTLFIGSCRRCHGNGLNGSPLAPFPLKERYSKLSKTQFRTVLKKGKRGTQMRGFPDLVEGEIKSLILYLDSI